MRILGLKYSAGFALLGVVVALYILSVLAVGVVQMVSEDQSTRSQQLYMDQAFLAAHASFEYALRQIGTTNPSPLPIRDLNSSVFSLDRYMAKIWSVTSDVSANNSFSIKDPLPVEGSCLVIDVSSATYRADVKQLIGITIQRNMTRCPNHPILITSMVISWTPDGNEKVTEIQFNNNPNKEFHDPAGQRSGTTFVLSPTFPMPDGTLNQLTDIQWKTSVNANAHFTLTFNMEDGSSVTVTI
jgi:type II secretory pathway pseudopilin PulG